MMDNANNAVPELAHNKDDESEFEDDDVSAVDDNTAGTSEDAVGKKGRDGKTNIAQDESRVVGLVRLFVFSLLLAVTAGVAVGVYFYVRNAETSSFNEDFEESSEKAFDSIGKVLDQAMGSSDNLMLSLISYQLTLNISWPFVALPDYAVRAQKILSLGRASVIGVYPKVTHDARAQWEQWALENQGWVDESIAIQKNNQFFTGVVVEDFTDYPHIHNTEGISPERPFYYPGWQTSPIVPRNGAWGWDLNARYEEDLQEVEKRFVVMGATRNLPMGNQTSQWIADRVGNDEDIDPSEPYFSFYYPIVEHANDAVSMEGLNDKQHEVVGVISTVIFWRKIFVNLLAPGSVGLVAVIGSACNQTLTFQVDGPEAKYLGPGDLHDSEYNDYGKFSYVTSLGSKKLGERDYTGIPLSSGHCPYWVHLYPSDTMKSQHESNDPIIFTVVTICIFLFTTLFFLIYDCVSERRQQKVLLVAEQSNAVVSNLFPQVVRDRIFPTQSKPLPKVRVPTAKWRLQQYLLRNDDPAKNEPDSNEQDNVKVAPIAELFSDTTVMFADIAGFTAWSSVREPSQVFTLLETLYGSFDRLANRRGVFKIETIGDSYVAVTGLPEPRSDHAVVMAKFARDIREKFGDHVQTLCKDLGPDTADLEIRIGMNSGPVTAGVLRGERSRFQLFGDTVNTAARMESTGVASKIQVTQTTAELIIKAGKSHWVTKRAEEVVAKGKGRIQTYWVEPMMRAMSSSSGQTDEDLGVEPIDEKTQRLVDWNVEVLAKLLKQIASRREAQVALGKRGRNKPSGNVKNWDWSVSKKTVLEEMQEVIMLPEFDPSVMKATRASKTIELSTEVVTQLREYISLIATMYPNNPFHNFEHASHVTMSVVKLMSRIVAPTDNLIEEAEKTKGELESSLHDHTYGITSDPLTQFSCVFSALIHDVDHPGVPNAQLIKEQSPLVAKYHGKSLAEQNSVDLAWKLLTQDQFADLRKTICWSEAEMGRFRQLVVNVVMATDIMDKELKNLRNQRWEKAFAERSHLGESPMENTNRKATIVIEHLIQASDVAHTMQHWHIFRKWNERLFEEMYKAYRNGRAEKNPAEFWYKGELGFFEFYIIPLAKKLNDCGVFGVSSHEYLNYAQRNKEEWESRGQEIVESMIANVEKSYGPTNDDQQNSQNSGDGTGDAATKEEELTALSTHHGVLKPNSMSVAGQDTTALPETKEDKLLAL